jgi:hypothetical protein
MNRRNRRLDANPCTAWGGGLLSGVDAVGSSGGQPIYAEISIQSQ